MEILSDRYFTMNKETLCGDYVFLAQKPYRMQFHNTDGVDSFSFHSECGAITMANRDGFLDWFIDEWELIEVKTYICPCCERIAIGERTTDYKRGGMSAYYVKDEIQNVRCFFNDEYHYFGLKIDYCPVCGGKV